MFAFAFLIYIVAGKFKLYEGDSEWRDLTNILLQVFVGTAVIYALCFTLPDRKPLLVLLQAVLYVDGAYIVAVAAVSVPISYLELKLNIPAVGRQIDLFATEWEKCLADNSLAYWLIRGDLQYYLFHDRWKPQDWANWFFDNFNYILIVPFLVVFALMLRPRKKLSFVLIIIYCLLGYTAAIETTAFLKRQISQMLADRDPICLTKHVDQIAEKYSPNLIAQQVLYKINNAATKADQLIAPLFLDQTNFVLALQFKPEATFDWDSVDKLVVHFRDSYCSSFLYWQVARRIKYGLLVVIYDSDKRLIRRQQSIPADCK
jgi:hypothetical protein